MNEELNVAAEEVVQDVKPKKVHKKYLVVLVTKSSVVYEDKGELKHIDKSAYEGVKIGDTIKI